MRVPLKQTTTVARKNMAASIVRFRRSCLARSTAVNRRKVLRRNVQIPQKRKEWSTGHCVAFATEAKKPMMLMTSSTVSPLNTNRIFEYNVFITRVLPPDNVDTLADSFTRNQCLP